ncbi:YeeE/YedE thiosulfate transporter family protein [Vibrio sp. YMD68]|uniref:YeeE/YedE family protein n=1 Tax=Vibrio sp. YMD68 TaxID=3042300 RepID=UPI00249BE2D8|nr:YeeE/YedE thiosulfate transporter family protein [Vibrio sp. YMD68]WGV98157.1 YeeE/YedE thiosulfate transporter family protein [Vibrio sp. YMD68]
MAFAVPWESLFGGMLLGLSAVILMLFSGKVAGISGVVGGLLNPQKHDSSWRAAFVVGLILSAVILAPLGFDLPDVSNNNIALVAVAGVLVGFGTRLANGCTSGHGIVGMGRFSVRSIVATCTFMITAIIVVWVKRQLGWV